VLGHSLVELHSAKTCATRQCSLRRNLGKYEPKCVRVNQVALCLIVLCVDVARLLHLLSCGGLKGAKPSTALIRAFAYLGPDDVIGIA
jgi:hypothetical protein